MPAVPDGLLAPCPHEGRDGYLALDLARAGGLTRLVRAASRAPLRVFRAIHADPDLPALAEVPVLHLGGGLLGGERLRVVVTVRAGAQARFTTVGATHLYPAPAGLPSEQDLRLEVEGGGLAEWLPEPLLPHAGCRYRQRTTLLVHPGARLFHADSLVAGRHPAEAFAFTRLELRTEIRSPAGDLLAADALTLDPSALPCTEPAAFGPYRALGSVLVIGEPPAIDALARALAALPGFAPAGDGETPRDGRPGTPPPFLAGFTRLADGAGLAVRVLGLGGARVADALVEVWRCWRRWALAAPCART